MSDEPEKPDRDAIAHAEEQARIRNPPQSRRERLRQSRAASALELSPRTTNAGKCQLDRIEEKLDSLLDDGEDDEDTGIPEFDPSETVYETPLDPKTLALNPGSEEIDRNPLCPECEEEIRPVSNDAERRFVCGCDELWQFTFDEVDDDP